MLMREQIKIDGVPIGYDACVERQRRRCHERLNHITFIDVDVEVKRVSRHRRKHRYGRRAYISHTKPLEAVF